MGVGGYKLLLTPEHMAEPLVCLRDLFFQIHFRMILCDDRQFGTQYIDVDHEVFKTDKSILMCQVRLVQHVMGHLQGKVHETTRMVSTEFNLTNQWSQQHYAFLLGNLDS